MKRSNGIVGIPANNHAIALRWQGFVDTDLAFSEFFFRPHTIMVRFMPQYPFAYAGPILAENGTGTYLVGQGDYYWGDFPGVGHGSGRPVLFVKIGDRYAKYLAPGLERGRWQHLAIVRTQGRRTGLLRKPPTVIKLYLNGVRLSRINDPTDEGGDLPLGDKDLPNGTMRLGRRTTGKLIDFTDAGDLGLTFGNYEGQFYGLIDDLAVFKRALTDEEIRAVIRGLNNDGRLTGQETDLYAGWSFDVPGMNYHTTPLPGILAREYGLQQPGASIVLVSRTRNSDDDAQVMAVPYPQFTLHLPFAVGQVWRVIQGYDNPEGSHNGYASFCWDFANADVPSFTVGQFLFAPAPGRLVNVEESNPAGSSNGNFVSVKYAEREFWGFLHIEQHSCSRFGFRPRPQDIAEWLRPVVDAGNALATVGDTGAPGNFHLHMAISNIDGRFGEPEQLITIPVAFSDYWANDGRGWYFVPRGVPQNGQLVKRGEESL